MPRTLRLFLTITLVTTLVGAALVMNALGTYPNTYPAKTVNDEECTVGSSESKTTHTQPAKLHQPEFQKPVVVVPPVDNPQPTLTPEQLQRQRIEFAAGVLAEDVLESLSGKYKGKLPKKIHSTLVLALETTHRRRVVLGAMQTLLTKNQFQRAIEVLAEQSPRFNDLLKRRHKIMLAKDRSAIPELLGYNDIAAQLLAKKLNAEIYATVVKETRRAERQRAQALARKKSETR